VRIVQDKAGFSTILSLKENIPANFSGGEGGGGNNEYCFKFLHFLPQSLEFDVIYDNVISIFEIEIYSF